MASKFVLEQGQVQHFLAFEKMIDESTSIGLRTNGSSGDTDGVISTSLGQNVDLRMCFGFDLRETDKATSLKQDYSTPYFGLNFDIKL